jgi:hypothetical protein
MVVRRSADRAERELQRGVPVVGAYPIALPCDAMLTLYFGPGSKGTGYRVQMEGKDGPNADKSKHE